MASTSFGKWRGKSVIVVSDSDSDDVTESGKCRDKRAIEVSDSDDVTESGNWRGNIVIEDSDCDDVIESSLVNKSDLWSILSSEKDSESDDISITRRGKELVGNKITSILVSEDEDDDKRSTDSFAGTGNDFQKLDHINVKSSSDSYVKDNRNDNNCFDPHPDNVENKSVKTTSDGSLKKREKLHGLARLSLPGKKSSDYNEELNDAGVLCFKSDSKLGIHESLNNTTKVSSREKKGSRSLPLPCNKKSLNDVKRLSSPKFNYNTEVDQIDISLLNISDNYLHNIAEENTGHLLAEKVRLETEIRKFVLSIKNKKTTLNSVNLNVLPDKGMKLKISLESDQRNLDRLNEQFDRVSKKLQSLRQHSVVMNKVSNQCDNFFDNNVEENKDKLSAKKLMLESDIKKVKMSIRDKKTTLNSIDRNLLPDKVIKLKSHLESEQRSLIMLYEQLSSVNEKLGTSQISVSKNIVSSEKSTKFASLPSANVQKMGVKALETYHVQHALTVDSLTNLHISLNDCPSDNIVVPDPTGLKIPLMIHQKQALAWLTWRENEKPSGGILADDMGLGKTLTMISLILKRNDTLVDSEDENGDVLGKNKYKGGTLIICPSSLIGQWETEINERVSRDLITYSIHHGHKRERKARRLAKFDIIITSYAIARVEFQNSSGDCDKAPLFLVNWRRVILDEAHVIRNHRSKTAEAIFQLKANHRWALTGTPLHNKMQDLYALIKFLRCRPFDDICVWKKWVEAKDETGMKRLNMLTKSLMLRRTKDVLISEGKLHSLPEKSSETITIHLSRDEMTLYEVVSNFSKTLLSQLIFQRAEKENALSSSSQSIRNKHKILEGDNFSKHSELNKLHKGFAIGNVKTHEILVLLLRLRQICCHPVLMKSMIEKEAFMHDGITDEDGLDFDLLEKMSAMNVNENDSVEDGERSRTETLKKNIFNPNNPIFKPEWVSSKIQAILQLLEESLLKTDDRIVIVSQWSSMLDLIYDFLKKCKNCNCDFLTGKVPVEQRMAIVSKFNDSSSSLKVLLLSLTAGGTGLNLVGGNHLIITDPHWNPQLEAQACDRIYRIGQCKPIKIYKFVCAETIEERIQLLQNDKLALANGVLSGVKQLQGAKLSLNDLKMLFSIN